MVWKSWVRGPVNTPHPPATVRETHTETDMENEEVNFVPVAIMSVMSCLISELNKAGNLDLGALIENIQGTAATHRARGSTLTADMIHRLSEYLLETVRDPVPPRDPRQP